MRMSPLRRRRPRGGRPPLLRRAAAALLLLAAAALATPPAFAAWGAKGHRLIGTAATQALPPDMPAFFRQAEAQLAWLNPEPDRWKARAERERDPALDGGWFADHFLDTELAPPPVLAAALAAPHRYAYIDSLRTAGVDAYALGFAPFAILELTQRVRQGFRMWRSAPDDSTRRWIEARIINDAGILGHYVADVANPAHTTIHYNGWVGANPRGFATDPAFHGRFETTYVQAHIELADVTPRVAREARVLEALRAEITAYIARGHAEVERLYELDQLDPWGLETRSPASHAFAAERLAAGATMLRDLWYTAWVTSTGSYREPG
jgi:hypothetical protein